jgi:hypothetical protein
MMAVLVCPPVKEYGAAVAQKYSPLQFALPTFCLDLPFDHDY